MASLEHIFGLLHLVEHSEKKFLSRVVSKRLWSGQKLLRCVEERQESQLCKVSCVLSLTSPYKKLLEQPVEYDKNNSLLVESLRMEVLFLRKFAENN